MLWRVLVIYIHVYKLLIWCSATTKSLSLFGLVRFVTLIGKVASMVFVLESNAFQSGNSDAYEFTFFFFPHLRMLNNATNWSFVVRKKEPPEVKSVGERTRRGRSSR